MHNFSTSNEPPKPPAFPKDREVKEGLSNSERYCLKIAGIFLLAAIFCCLLFSCTSTKNIQTSRVNVDSIVDAEKLKLTQKHESEIKEYQKQLEELTSSGVTFVVDSCPERDLLPLLLDSTGKANYEKMLLANRIKSLSNKVTISEKGLITAEGNISAAYFSKSLLEKELQRSEHTIDSMQVELDSSHARLTRSEITKDKQVKRRSLFGGYAMAFGGGALCMLLFLWWFNTKRKVKSTIMNKVTLFILTMLTLTSCGKFSDGTSIWAGGVWVIPILMLAGGLVLLYFAYRASKSNSTQQTLGGTKDNTGNVPIYKVGKFWLAVALFVAAIVVVLVQNSEK